MSAESIAERVREMALDLGMLNAALASDNPALGDMIEARARLLMAESTLRELDDDRLDLAARYARARTYVDTLQGADALRAEQHLRHWRGTGTPMPAGEPDEQLVAILRGEVPDHLGRLATDPEFRAAETTRARAERERWQR